MGERQMTKAEMPFLAHRARRSCKETVKAFAVVGQGAPGARHAVAGADIECSAASNRSVDGSPMAKMISNPRRLPD